MESPQSPLTTVPETYVDLYSATRQNFVAAYNSILTQGTTLIKIRATGTKNVASTGTYVILTISNSTRLKQQSL